MKVSYPKIILKPGRDKSLLNRHPWLFSGAIADASQCQSGEIVQVVSHRGDFLASGMFSPKSQIRVRLFCWDPSQSIDASFMRKRLAASIERRTQWRETLNSNACRLVFSESDLLPGLIVDQYNDALVVQHLTVGMLRWKDEIHQCLQELLQPRIIIERHDEKAWELEGLDLPNPSTAVEEKVTIIENGIRFLVNLSSGQKTGFYLDQRENRRRVGTLAKDRRVLDCFSFSGGFTMHAALNGAKSVTAIDSSAKALELLQENSAINEFSAKNISTIKDDAFSALRRLKEAGESYDLIIMDPPKLAFRARDVASASRGYKDLNLLAFKLLAPGGWLATFSCSGLISSELFQKIVFGAALDAEVDAQIHEYFHQPSDHPVHLNFPEAAYLNGVLCHKISHE